MIRQYLRQVTRLWRANPLFSFISALATALTIAFVMTLYMVYSFKTMDIAPEINRSRLLYSVRGFSYLTKDQSQMQSGLSGKVAKQIFGNLRGAELVSYCVDKGEGAAYVGTSAVNSDKAVVSPVDDAYFRMFRFEFLAGQAFTAEQAQAGRRECIITDRLATKLYGTVEALGKTISINFKDYRVVGVVKEVSSFFNRAYSDVWVTFDQEDLNWAPERSEGLLGNCQVFVLTKPGVSLSDLEKEIEAKVVEVNDNLREFTFELTMTTQARSSFFAGEKNNPVKIFVFAILILLVVPAINMSGLLSTQMKKRQEEIGVRKAYGATNTKITGQLLFENLILTLIGGFVGLLLSFAAIVLFKNLLLADIMAINASEAFDLPVEAFFSLRLFGWMLLFCILVNFLSAAIPVWNASRTTVIQIIKGE